MSEHCKRHERNYCPTNCKRKPDLRPCPKAHQATMSASEIPGLRAQILGECIAYRNYRRCLPTSVSANAKIMLRNPSTDSPTPVGLQPASSQSTLLSTTGGGYYGNMVSHVPDGHLRLHLPLPLGLPLTKSRTSSSSARTRITTRRSWSASPRPSKAAMHPRLRVR